MIELALSLVLYGQSWKLGFYKACIYYAPYSISRRYYSKPYRVIIHPDAACPKFVRVKK